MMVSLVGMFSSTILMLIQSFSLLLFSMDISFSTVFTSVHFPPQLHSYSSQTSGYSILTSESWGAGIPAELHLMHIFRLLSVAQG